MPHRAPGYPATDGRHGTLVIMYIGVCIVFVIIARASVIPGVYQPHVAGYIASNSTYNYSHSCNTVIPNTTRA